MNVLVAYASKYGATRAIAELREAVQARGHRVFFGALGTDKLGFTHRLMRALPAGRVQFPEGDFRDWPAIDAWAAGIAAELTAAPAGRATRTAG
jgi:menaquinone-dependent protoporphyrinogen oxidase